MFISTFENNHVGKFSIKTKNLDKDQIEIALRKKFHKTYEYQVFETFLKDLGINVPTCRVCRSFHVPHRFVIDIQDGKILILGSEATRQYQYCYGKSKKCKELSVGRKMNPNSAKFISLVLGLSEEDAKQYIRNNNKSSFYKENFLSLEDYKDSQKRDLNYFVSKHGESLGKIKYNQAIEKQNFKRSKEFYIQTYGKTLGLEKFSIYNRKRTTKFRGISKWSLQLIQQIVSLLDLKENDQIFFGKNEFSLSLSELNKTYFFDFCLIRNQIPKLIEFNGAVWHAPPNLNEDQKNKWRQIRSNKTWLEVYLGDEKKYNAAKLINAKLMVVWDFEKEKDIIERCLGFLNE